jgi:hypothetical protein
LFHGPSLWLRLVPKLWLVDMLFRHTFLFLKFFFFFPNVVSGPLSNGPLNFCIKWKDGWILELKPVHEIDSFRKLQQLQCYCVEVPGTALDRWRMCIRSHLVCDRSLVQRLGCRKLKQRRNAKYYLLYIYFFENDRKFGYSQ